MIMIVTDKINYFLLYTREIHISRDRIKTVFSILISISTIKFKQKTASTNHKQQTTSLTNKLSRIHII